MHFLVTPKSDASATNPSRLDRISPLREVRLPLLLSLRLQRRLLLGQMAAHGARELGPQVEGRVLLLLVEQAELGALRGVDDGEDAGDAFPDVGSVRAFRQSSCSSNFNPPRGPQFCIRLHPVQLGRSATGDLLRAQRDELLPHVLELLHQVIFALAPQLVGFDVARRRLEGIVSGFDSVDSRASLTYHLDEGGRG
jgi:hypothetical protein